ncbi:Zinc-ribbon domain-containing protein [Sulfidibacter corallicola]|uniref:Zinc-ribbon domain-containing protein n=1 Tax=Sulfidibacter corallicola TaxID=2818388 RepID=A0A8A4TVA2_SULCO|nr:zinc-ribbon domain-containing protein [Sulfidibacter corallicola]QTD53051.1 zinc-ribbon domain-containing protein [Sulfidibacter corallicola]
MIITCPSCGARYKVKDELITEKGKKVKCKKCTSIFKAFPGDKSVLVSSPKTPVAKPQAAPSTAAPASAGAGIKVKVGGQQPATQPAAPPPTETDAPATVSAQATVRVDRSMLQDYLKQAQNQSLSDKDAATPAPSISAFAQEEDDFTPPEPPKDESATVQIDPNQIAPSHGLDAGSTVAVDRDKLNSLLQQSDLDTGRDTGIDAGSTVAVDRSQLDHMLQKNEPPAAPEPPAENQDAGATLAVDRSQLDAFLKEKGPEDLVQPPTDDAGSTVAVDRSQLDAFLSESGSDPDFGEVGFDESEDEEPFGAPAQDNGDAGATVAVDRSQLDQFLKKAAAEEADTPAPPSFDDFKEEEDPLGDSFGGFGDVKNPVQPSPADTLLPSDDSQDRHEDGEIPEDDTATLAMEPTKRPHEQTQDPLDQAVNFSLDEENEGEEAWKQPTPSPDFPTDEELGIQEDDPFKTVHADEPPNFKDVDASDFGLDQPEPELSPTERAAHLDEAPPPPPADQPSIPLDDAGAGASQGPTFQAWIDDQVYPDLTLESLERWVIEDRLLETDLLAPNGSEDYTRADEVPEVAAFFQKHGKSGTPPEPAPPEKKGFFGWLKSLFKK